MLRVFLSQYEKWTIFLILFSKYSDVLLLAHLQVINGNIRSILIPSPWVALNGGMSSTIGAVEKVTEMPMLFMIITDYISHWKYIVSKSIKN